MATCLAEQDLQYIDEAWGILPKSLSVVDTVSGQKLYSSDAVRNKFLDAISNQKILKPVEDKIENLVERQIIIPCFANRNLIHLIGHKFFSDQYDRLILGYYESSKNKVYIMLDNHTKFLVFMSNKALGSLTMHELQHYASNNLKSKFYNLNKEVFRQYFRNFYKMYMNVNLTDTEIDDFVKFTFKNFEYPKRTPTNFLVRFADVMFDDMEKHIPDEQTRETKIRNLLAVLKIYLTNPSVFMTALSSGHPEVVGVVSSLYKSYRSLGISNPRSTTIQEIIFPSEVICIQSQFKTNKNHYAAIKAL